MDTKKVARAMARDYVETKKHHATSAAKRKIAHELVESGLPLSARLYIAQKELKDAGYRPYTES